MRIFTLGGFIRHTCGSTFCYSSLLLAAASSTAAHSQKTTPDALFAANHIATGGDAWDQVGSIRLKGQVIAGGASGSFEQEIDRHTGFSRTVTVNGGLRDESGFDGSQWDKQNGILTIADLPSLVLDARSQAFVLRDGWWTTGASYGPTSQHTDKGRVFDVVSVTPDGGSPVEAWLDHATHLIDHLTFSTDAGPLTSVFSDWQTVGGVRLAFRRVDTDSTGQVTTTIVREARVEPRLGKQALARPAPESHALTTRKRGAEIPFDFTGFDRGHVVVPAKVDGKSATLIFDSGGANYFGPAAALKLGLVAGGGINIGGVGTSSVTGGFATVRRISIGWAGLRDQSVIVGPLPYPALHPRSGMNVDGLIGFEFLSEYRTTFDYSRRTISFSAFDGTVAKPGVTLPFVSDGHSIYVEAEVEGAKGLFRLDTGDGGGMTLFATFAERNRLFRGGGVATLGAGGVGGSLASRRFEAADIRFAGQHFQRAPVVVSGTSSGSFASRSIAGNIGAALISRFRVTFDYRERTVTFLPAPDLQRPFRHDLTGLSLAQEDQSALVVLSVAPGSPSATAGIKPKDRIVAIDERSVKEDNLGIFDLAAPRYDVAPFTLRIERGSSVLVYTVHPADYLRPVN